MSEEEDFVEAPELGSVFEEDDASSVVEAVIVEPAPSKSPRQWSSKKVSVSSVSSTASSPVFLGRKGGAAQNQEKMERIKRLAKEDEMSLFEADAKSELDENFNRGLVGVIYRMMLARTSLDSHKISFPLILFDRYRDLLADQNPYVEWTEMETMDGVTRHVGSARGTIMIKAAVDIPDFHPEIVNNFIYDVKNTMRKYDPMVSRIDIAEEFGPDFDIMYSQTSIPVIKNRDMLMARVHAVVEDAMGKKEWFAICRSVRDDERFPVSSKYIRATMLLGGYHMTELATGGTRLSYLSQIVYGGNLPPGVAASVVKKRTQVIAVMRDVMLKWPDVKEQYAPTKLNDAADWKLSFFQMMQTPREFDFFYHENVNQILQNAELALEDIPSQLLYCVSGVYSRNGHHEEGILRISCVRTEKAEQINQLGRRFTASPPKLEEQSPHMFGALLFAILTKNTLIDNFNWALNVASKEEIEKGLNGLNFKILKFLMHFVADLGREEYAKDTKMGVDNILLLFTPLLLIPPKNSSAKELMEAHPKSVAAMKKIFQMLTEK
jgi:hypothetical protein